MEDWGGGGLGGGTWCSGDFSLATCKSIYQWGKFFYSFLTLKVSPSLQCFTMAQYIALKWEMEGQIGASMHMEGQGLMYSLHDE